MTDYHFQIYKPTEDFTGRVTLILDSNFVAKCWLTMATQFFTSIHIFKHAMLINAYAQEFTLTNNAFLSYIFAFEHLLY